MKSVKEMIQAMLDGETLVSVSNPDITFRFDESFDGEYPFFCEDKSNEIMSTRIKNPPTKPKNWRILKPKKRRVIKDRAKLARVLLDDGYVPNELYWKKTDHLKFFHSMFSSCGDMVIKDEYGTYKVPNPGDDDYFFLEKWTEEYDDDE